MKNVKHEKIKKKSLSFLLLYNQVTSIGFILYLVYSLLKDEINTEFFIYSFSFIGVSNLLLLSFIYFFLKRA
ncbi:hypothetical protein HNR74_003454 [Flammeovirga kamogawensis]|nr:hypothetical protein [Flammeovirga kamogawensis]